MSKNSTNNKGVAQDILIIMDRSGSMAAMGSEPLEALNSFIKDQQSVISEDGARLSLWMFDTNASLIIDDQLLKDVKPITNYVPIGMTAMYDAIGKAVSLKYNKNKKDNVVCMVITDGCDNSSEEFTVDDTRRLINLAENNDNWKFIFLGAKDIFSQGANTGFDNGRCVSYSPSINGTLTSLSRDISQTVANYRSITAEGVSADLTLNNIKLNEIELEKNDDVVIELPCLMNK